MPDQTPSLLDRLWEDIPTGPVPIDALLVADTAHPGRPAREVRGGGVAHLADEHRRAPPRGVLAHARRRRSARRASTGATPIRSARCAWCSAIRRCSAWLACCS